MAMLPEPLPIEPALPALASALASVGCAVLQAPPGAGKTTRVPLALLKAEWLGRRRIVMLEPRRLAARAAAQRMADLVGAPLGGLVGYRIRHESLTTAATRIEVVTEGVLTRMLQADPALERAGLIIFDEFHERSLQADLGLALTLQSRAILRPDLRILVMSATLDGASVAALLGDAPVVTSEGHSWPVSTVYLPPRSGARLETSVAGAVRRALAEEAGDVLAFLPGAAEIRRTAALLTDVSAEVIPLHGSLGRAAQDRALRPAARAGRKVVLATSIAETSLTIDGIRVVIDGGWSRVPRYSPRSGMTRLATVRVSHASADQRRGRAGRQGPGVCFRLWSKAEDASHLPRASPEILEADLAPLALELAAGGVSDPAELAWLDPPPTAAMSAARTVLRQLEALDLQGRITAHGRRLVRLALHPRLAHMVVRGRELGSSEACDLAALLAGRDLLPGGRAVDADLSLRLDLLRGRVERADVDAEALRLARLEAALCRRSWQARAGETGTAPSAGLLLALAYPDRIAQRRPGGPARYLLRSGQGAALDPQPLASEAYLVAAELDGRVPEGRILLALPIGRDEIERHFANEVVDEDVLTWDRGEHRVLAKRRRRLGAIVLEEFAVQRPDPSAVSAALLEGVRLEGIDRLPWTAEAARLRARLAFMHCLDSAWPDVSNEALARDLELWLEPFLAGITSFNELSNIDLGHALLSRIPKGQRTRLDRWAPSHVQLPSGSRIPVDYSDPAAPVLSVRLQELFGQAETPTVGEGRVTLTLHLLSPARRPVQVTRDLAGFWRKTYFEVRKDLRGRYPKHPWPDDPMAAVPTGVGRRRPGEKKGT
ncbi:MAG TPA: ATP-dependent helicase HrpB [Gemmatimonadales bacterium]|nr:ATP-dependent helicase HrpB [Gemmatimonadales bacterium]